VTQFDLDTALADAGDGRYEGVIADGWATPRGPLGGYVMALVLRAFELAADDPERQPRSATMHFLRVPEVGPISVSVVLERVGRSVTAMTGRLEQGDKLLGLALGAYSTAWESPHLDGGPIPEVEPAVGREPVPALGRGTPPAFTEQLTMQHRFGSPPFSNADEGLTGGWLGLREERPIDALAIAVLADAWFPAPWPRLGALSPAPTIDLTLHFRAPLPLADGLLLGRFRNRLVRDGFFDEDGELWSADGTLVAQSRQLALLLAPTA